MIHLWLAYDPETTRITAQAREFGDDDFPRGGRGRGWAIHEIDIPEDVWQRMLLGADGGGFPPEEQDAMHRDWWEKSDA